jgi:SAM-dependent methyltransferase
MPKSCIEMPDFHNLTWQKQYRGHQNSILKQGFYACTRPFLSAYGRQFLSSETLRQLNPLFVLPGRGFPLESRRRWGAELCKVSDSVILVQGTGTGWDVISWARLKPKKIIATDLFTFEQSWDEIKSYCHQVLGVEVSFHQASLEDHDFLASESIDLCASDAVFEHCTDLKSVLKESWRLLKPGACLYASYGPLWFCSGGDHFSGRGGLQNVFNHLLLTPENYQKYFSTFLEPNEDFQSGGRYVELDLFSKLRTQDYIKQFQSCNFYINSLILQLSPTSFKFRKNFPELFNQLQEQYINRCIIDDFLISANLIRLVKPMISS